MIRHQLRRGGAVLISSTVVTALAVTALAGPAAAAKPTCMGQKATIVGTDKADVLLGSAKRDVIVARAGNDIIIGRGGNDIICAGAGDDRVAGNAGSDRIAGQVGDDRLFGGAGADYVFGGAGSDLVAGNGGVDRLFGGPSNDVLFGGLGPDVIGGGKGDDTLAGGVGVDLCSQGAGMGVKIDCELPPAAAAPVVPVPADLVVAYSDIDGKAGYTDGDVLIAKIVDTNLDGVVSQGDTIKMDKFPKELWPGTPSKPAPFGEWRKKTHEIMHVDEAGSKRVDVSSKDGRHLWVDDAKEVYFEETDGATIKRAASNPQSRIVDAFVKDVDNVIAIQSGSPSDPDDDPYSDDSDERGDEPHVLEVDINL